MSARTESVVLFRASIDVCADLERCLAALSEWSILRCLQRLPTGRWVYSSRRPWSLRSACGVNNGAPDCENPDHEVLVRRDITTNGELNVCGVARAVQVSMVCAHSPVALTRIVATVPNTHHVMWIQEDACAEMRPARPMRPCVERVAGVNALEMKIAPKMVLIPAWQVGVSVQVTKDA